MKLDHITILVSSMEKSMPYYDALLPMLGFSKVRNRNWTDGEGFYLQFLQTKSETGPYERYGVGMNHLGFGAASKEQVDSVRTAMQQSGFDVPQVQGLGGAYALFMKDPDGIRFEITWYPPGVSVID